jgi:predicted TIM-barrel fold metal-dependent hydrolase
LGEDRILFGSDYAIWSPKWIIDKFMSFQLPDDIREEFGVELTPAIKRKIMGENTARLYGIDIDAHRAKLAGDQIGVRLAAAA